MAVIRIYFSDYFEVSPADLKAYGAYNISLINDLPLFIDPFLLFGSDKKEYQELHESMLKYMDFLKTKSSNRLLSRSEIMAWYQFPEVKQNWLGYSRKGNAGSGLGPMFGEKMSKSINTLFEDLGSEKVTQSSHIEKVCLFSVGVGRDNISDFTTNLIKSWLLAYTEGFAKKYIDKKYLKEFTVEKAYFNYTLERWMPQEYLLPVYNEDFVILTPRDILTKDENWINNNDLHGDFMGICRSIPNEQLRAEITNYFQKCLPIHSDNKPNTQKEIRWAQQRTIDKYPEIINWYIKQKEENKVGASTHAMSNVESCEQLFNEDVLSFVTLLHDNTEFYGLKSSGSYDESMRRVKYLKQAIETNDVYRIFYEDGKPIRKEQTLQLIFRLVWYGTSYDVNREVNNGRGPADYIVSMGALDKTIVEFKLASNSKLKQNLEHQVEIYKEANKTNQSITVILYFTESELKKLTKILNELNLANCPDIVLIDAGEKESASNVKN